MNGAAPSSVARRCCPGPAYAGCRPDTPSAPANSRRSQRSGRPSPVWRATAAMSASHSRAADSTSVSSTGWSSKVERLMTFSTSAVAVCCCNSSSSSRYVPGLRRRGVVLDRDHRLIREGGDEVDLPLIEGPDLAASERHDADRLAVAHSGTPSRVRYRPVFFASSQV